MIRSAISLLAFASIGLQGELSQAAQPKTRPAIDQIAESQRGIGILIDGQTYSELQSLPSDLMSSAQKAFQEKNYAEVSADLRTAARILRLSSIDNTDTQSIRQMRSAANGLEQVARKIRFGEITDSQQLLASLAQAMYFKSNYDRLRAVDAWASKQLQRAGYDLRASTNELEQASRWSGQKMEKGNRDVIAAARVVAGKLEKGSGWTTIEVGKAIDHLGLAVAKLGKSVVNGGTRMVRPQDAGESADENAHDIPASDVAPENAPASTH